jgi:hypothetical protein
VCLAPEHRADAVEERVDGGVGGDVAASASDAEAGGELLGGACGAAKEVGLVEAGAAA